MELIGLTLKWFMKRKRKENISRNEWDFQRQKIIINA